MYRWMGGKYFILFLQKLYVVYYVRVLTVQNCCASATYGQSSMSTAANNLRVTLIDEAMKKEFPLSPHQFVLRFLSLSFSPLRPFSFFVHPTVRVYVFTQFLQLLSTTPLVFPSRVSVSLRRYSLVSTHKFHDHIFHSCDNDTQDDLWIT